MAAGALHSVGSDDDEVLTSFQTYFGSYKRDLFQSLRGDVEDKPAGPEPQDEKTDTDTRGEGGVFGSRVLMVACDDFNKVAVTESGTLW